MTYGRRALSGLLGAVLAVAAWIAFLLASVALDFARSRQAGVGSISIVVDTNHLLIAAVIGFAAGWFWRARRQRH